MIPQQRTSKTLHMALWVVQVLLALLFIGTGLFKLVIPTATLAGIWPWAGEYPSLVGLTGIVDILGGTGLVLPALTRTRPSLTAWAALGCAALLLCAIGFHLSRGEGANTPVNFIVLTLTLFVFWGRRRKEPISTRS